MSINWFASLKGISWENVRSMAPSIVESGKKIWSKIATREAQVSEAEFPALQNLSEQATPSGGEVLAGIEIRVQVLERRIAQLKEESVSSFEVVRSLADQLRSLGEQHSELVRAVDALLVRTDVLVRVCVILGLFSLALFILILIK